jgi:Flp pilus assembly pilin Flp
MLLKREEGQGLVEYALIIFLIAIVAIIVMSLTGTQITAAVQAFFALLGGT